MHFTIKPIGTSGFYLFTRFIKFLQVSLKSTDFFFFNSRCTAFYCEDCVSFFLHQKCWVTKSAGLQRLREKNMLCRKKKTCLCAESQPCMYRAGSSTHGHAVEHMCMYAWLYKHIRTGQCLVQITALTAHAARRGSGSTLWIVKQILLGLPVSNINNRLISFLLQIKHYLSLHDKWMAAIQAAFIYTESCAEYTICISVVMFGAKSS